MKLGRTGSALEGRGRVEKDLERLESWASPGKVNNGSTIFECPLAHSLTFAPSWTPAPVPGHQASAPCVNGETRGLGGLEAGEP